MVLIMDNKIVKSVLCLLLVVLIFAGIGCTGRSICKNDEGSASTASPTPAPAAAPVPGTTMQPGNAGNNTTDPGIDDLWFSGGDEDYLFPEDLLPAPPAE
jgi:hypothetical protein